MMKNVIKVLICAHILGKRGNRLVKHAHGFVNHVHSFCNLPSASPHISMLVFMIFQVKSTYNAQKIFESSKLKILSRLLILPSLNLPLNLHKLDWLGVSVHCGPLQVHLMNHVYCRSLHMLNLWVCLTNLCACFTNPCAQLTDPFARLRRLDKWESYRW